MYMNYLLQIQVSARRVVAGHAGYDSAVFPQDRTSDSAQYIH